MEILLTVLTFVPLIFILWLANLAERSATAARAARPAISAAWEEITAPHEPSRLPAILAYLLLVIFYGMLISFGILIQAIGLLAGGPMAPSLGEAYTQMGIAPEAFGRMGLGLWLPSLFGILFLLPFVRGLASRLLPEFRRESPVHAVALSYTALIIANLLFTVGMGLGNIANLMQQSAPLDLTPTLWAQEICMALMALIGVGWLTRRSLAEGLRRLGIVPLKWNQILAGVGIGATLGVAVVVLEMLLARIGIVTDADVERLSEQLLGPLVKTPFGILTLGLAAALGEEPLFRGALQPRFGVLVTTVLFALLHSTYGLSLATAIVFGVGLVLALVRLRANTSTCMLVHATYNITLGVIAASGLLR